MERPQPDESAPGEMSWVSTDQRPAEVLRAVRLNILRDQAPGKARDHSEWGRHRLLCQPAVPRHQRQAGQQPEGDDQVKAIEIARP
jgi:hypothetical protein